MTTTRRNPPHLALAGVAMVAALATVVLLTGCGSGDTTAEATAGAAEPGPADGSPSGATDAATQATATAPDPATAARTADTTVDYTAVVDVRTPGEFAAGHVVEADNIDVQSADFTERIAALPDVGTYLVYCRSGNRSGQAAALMREAGLSVVDGGGLSDMEAAGYSFTD